MAGSAAEFLLHGCGCRCPRGHYGRTMPDFFSSAEGLKPQATSVWISRRSSLILQTARATPADVDPS